MTDFSKDFYTVEQVQKNTGFSKASIWRWCRESKVDHLKISDRAFLISKNKKNEDFFKERLEVKKKITKNKK